MDSHRKPEPQNFAGYLQSTVQLEALERMTQTLGTELADSQRVMLDIRAMLDSIPSADNISEDPTNSRMIYEEITKKDADVDVPKLLLPDMTEVTMDVDLDHVISAMKSYVEELKKSFVQTQKTLAVNKAKEIKPLDLEQYASNLDQLSKRLAYIKLSKKEKYNNKNPHLENKLAQLCLDVNMFTQMVQAKTTLSECNKNWSETEFDKDSLYYENIINKLLSGINAVTYLLQNNN